jgi:hypothetical protein
MEGHLCRKAVVGLHERFAAVGKIVGASEVL